MTLARRWPVHELCFGIKIDQFCPCSMFQIAFAIVAAHVARVGIQLRHNKKKCGYNADIARPLYAFFCVYILLVLFSMSLNQAN